MPPSSPRLKILSVGGNAVSAFLSWRLQATNACDVTVVWKNAFDAVSQYGITFKSKYYGNERFKPYRVVRTPEEAATGSTGYDYVLLCVKALPDVYNLADIIESVVTPQHTCILINTTNNIGIESHLEAKYPTNVIVSLVSSAELVQIGSSEFEHTGSTEVWVGAASGNESIPTSIQSDMAEALALTLSSGQVDCRVSDNIRQQQWEKMIGPISFFPTSVLFDTPSHSVLMNKPGVSTMINGLIIELMQIAMAQGCHFREDFLQKTIATMTVPSSAHSIMYQDYMSRRPMEIEVYLGNPMKMAQSLGLLVPRLETLYALLHNVNAINQTRAPGPQASPGSAPPIRLGHGPPPRGSTPGRGGPNGMMPRGGRMSSLPNRGHPMNGFARGRGGFGGQRVSGPIPRQASFDTGDLEQEFGHIALYDGIAEHPDGGPPMPGMSSSMDDMHIRERELALRSREVALREREMHMRGGPSGRRVPSRSVYNDDEDDDDYFPGAGTPSMPAVDADNFDMMSVTSRRTRKAPSSAQLRNNPEGMTNGGGRRPGFFNRNRTSTTGMQDIPGLRDSLLDNPLMGYSSNRYGAVDRKAMHTESRTNSITTQRMDDMSTGQSGPYPAPNHRTSRSPGDPYSAVSGRGMPSPMTPANGYPGKRISPPNGAMRQPVPRYPPGQGNHVAPQQVENYARVSTNPPKMPYNARTLTGSASASAGSGDSGASGLIDSENSAQSSQSSLTRRHPAIAGPSVSVR